MTSSMNFVFMVLGLVAVSLRNVHTAISDEERLKIHTVIIPFMAECGKEFGVTPDEIKAAKESGHLGELNPCLMACVFRKINVLDKKGLFDTNAAGELVKKYISNEEEQNKLIEAIQTCKSVNSQTVSDGEEGCERAKLLFDCAVPFRGQFIPSRR